MLTGQQIRDANLIIGGADEMYRLSTYDLRIGQIITNDKETHTRYKIPAQGIVQVISMEHVKVPFGMTGLATVKTSLCNEGVLALSIGIIDPGYEGLISSFLVNFARDSQVLARGDPFLRLQFVPLPVSTAPAIDGHRTPGIDDRTYVAARLQAAGHVADTFLNLSAEVRSAVDEKVNDRFKTVLLAAGGFAFLLAVMTFLSNFGTLAIVKGWLQPTDTVRSEIYRGELNDELAQMKKLNADLVERVRTLESRLPPTPPPAPRP